MASTFEAAFEKANIYDQITDLFLIPSTGDTYKSFICKIERVQLHKMTAIKAIANINFRQMTINAIASFNQNYNYELIDRIRKLYSLHKGHGVTESQTFSISYDNTAILDKFDSIISEYIVNRKCTKWGIKSQIMRYLIDSIIHDFESKNPNIDLLGFLEKIHKEVNNVSEESKKTILDPVKDELPDNQTTRNKINNTIETVSDIMTFAKDVNELVKRFKHHKLIQDKVDLFVKDLYSLTKEIINSQEQNFNK